MVVLIVLKLEVEVKDCFLGQVGRWLAGWCGKVNIKSSLGLSLH